MSIAARLTAIRANIPSNVTLVAVSKRQDAQAVRIAYEAGQRHFGENYVEEMKEKAEMVWDRIHYVSTHVSRKPSQAY